MNGITLPPQFQTLQYSELKSVFPRATLSLWFGNHVQASASTTTPWRLMMELVAPFGYVLSSHLSLLIYGWNSGTPPF